MTEREELIEQIAELSARKSRLARKSLEVESVNPGLADLFDSWWDDASDEIGRLQHRLHEIDARQSRIEMLADAAYGRNPP